MPFSVIRETTADGDVVRVAGEVDLRCAGELAEAMRVPAGVRFSVDLAETTFMDSSALNVLIGAVRDGAVFEVRNASSSVRKLFELTGLLTYLSVT